MNNELINFCADPQLVELLERSKSSEDLLDLLTPRENQHSDLLAWCFNAREGHGQGDGILKDFLLAVFRAGTADKPGDQIFGRGLTRDFVSAWPPSRILTSSFSTAICYREFTLQTTSGDTTNMRLDLVVVDTENQLLIVIENKAGARFRSGQLKGYLEGTQKTLLARAALKDFQVAFVAMDANYDAETELSENDNFDPRWARLNYDWLRSGAKRAEFAVKRGNQSAALLLSYCRRQTGWESEAMQTMTRLARDLAIRYPRVIEQMQRVASKLRSPDSWTPGLLLASSVDGQLLRLYLQNEIAISKLFDLSSLQLLHARLCEHAPQLDGASELSEYGRVWRNYQLPFDRPIPMVDSQWPLFMRIRHIDPEIKGQTKIRIALHWRPACVPEEDRLEICTLIGRAYETAMGTANRKNGVTLFSEVFSSVDAAEAAAKNIFKRCNDTFEK
ncbi:PDDEXK-like family protein [Duganella levis]|uniref:PD-(D/E)XK nuclease superfamily protein n=1 Tax=Duganella levis TaxID=2692169 RepID=A0ABW9W918_9BURK|nr:PD-(D/E)XK nuclease family protein [Duganella levis]MYN30596.1 hypothetical protein [Duganella levis]